MKELHEILNPLFVELNSIEEVVLINEDGEAVYTFPGDKSNPHLTPSSLQTLSILIRGIGKKINDEPRFFIGEMKQKYIIIIFCENLSFVMLLKSNEEIGYIRLKLEEIQHLLGNLISSLNENKTNDEEDIELKIPDEQELNKLLKIFSFLEA